jgi:hypothetical protein
LLRHFEDEITFTTYRTMYSRKRASIWKISFLCRAKFARWYSLRADCMNWFMGSACLWRKACMVMCVFVKRLDDNSRVLQQFKINEWYLLVRKLNLKFM